MTSDSPASAVRWSPARVGVADGTAAWIGGAAITTVPALDVEDPALGIPMGAVGEADAGLVDAAVHGAQRSAWTAATPRERGRTLHSIADRLRLEKVTLATIEAVDTGKPLSQAASDVDVAADYFDYYGALADKMFGRTIPRSGPALAFTEHEPYGVSAHITPWNSPLSQMCRGIAPALAAGNTVVVKPSELTPYSTLWCADLFGRAGLPAGACNVVIGRGPATGADLVAHPGVGQVSFTGSVATGREILRLAATGIKPCTLELGGKSPLVVFADADLARAAAAGAFAVIRNTGQSCFAPTRMIVDRRVRDEFVDLLAARLARATGGHPLDEPDYGPLSSRAALDRVRGYLDSAEADGVGVIGRAERGPGYFLAPTVLVGVRNDMRVAREEIFGPVQSVIDFDEPEEAIALANDTPYGLTATVYTRDGTRALAVAQRLRAGQVHVNRYPSGGIDVPFGGYKASGMGREKGWEAMLSYLQTKAYVIDTDWTGTT